MRKLIFTLLVGVGACTGGGGGGDLGTITAKWSFVTVTPTADAKGTLSTIPTCPPNINTAAVHTTRLVGGVPDSTTEKIDLFTCSDFIGDLPRAPGAYETFIAMTSQGGGTVYGQSLAAIVDITTVDKTFTTSLVDNGGYFQLDWTLKGMSSNATLDCAGAGATKVGIDATNVPDSSINFATELPCANGTGVSNPVLTGDWAVSISALDNSGSLGHFDTPTVSIPRANGVRDLNSITIPIANK